ncbi:MAG: transposase [Phycisphaerae bacterium]
MSGRSADMLGGMSGDRRTCLSQEQLDLVRNVADNSRAMAPPTITKYKRCRRYNVPGHAHELTFTCFRGFKLLSKDRTRWWLVDAIDRARARYAFDVWAYVIMPEHVHLLIFPRESVYSISRILTAIKWPVARAALNYLRANHSPWIAKLTDRQPNGRVAVRFWQRGGGYDRNITKESTLYEAIQYIHDNPVRRGLADCSTGWDWSSAAGYEGKRNVPLALDDTLPVMHLNGGRKHVRP